MSPPVRASLIALLILGAVCLLVAPGSVAADQQGDEELEPEWNTGTNVSIDAQLEADGDAQWRIQTTFDLESENETEAFRSVAADFENGDLPPLGLDAFEAGLAGVNDQTDRQMAIEGVNRITASREEVQNGTGWLAVEFVWENFAAEEGDRLRIDRDVLVMENGELWFTGLSEGQSLTIVAPPEFGVRDATVSAQDGQLQWQGPMEFDETTLQALFIGPNNDSNGNGGSVSEPATESFPWLWMALPFGAAGLLVAVLLARTDRAGIDPPVDIDTASLPLIGGSESASENDDSAGGGTVTPPATETTEADGESTEEIDEELLSDEERVERLLQSNGGRMKQANIVKETDWSNAKVSQLLSSMEEDGRIDKLRIGRENLISFPDEDITDSDE